MKNIILLFSISSLIFSCEHQKDKKVQSVQEQNMEPKTSGQIESAPKVEHITIKNTETYVYNLGGFGDEEGAFVGKEPKHAEVSEMSRDEKLIYILYTYKPTKGFVGADEVELVTMRGSSGDAYNPDSEIIILKFNVIE
ncbi:hypothetical protein GO491_00815 [Flavobacteriaceae bacterium Ap0902]|nr:hypothetical protein [Flavobacteriaceae bacterium Ap0902]